LLNLETHVKLGEVEEKEIITFWGGYRAQPFLTLKKVSLRRRSLFAFLNLIVNIFKLFHPQWALGW